MKRMNFNIKDRKFLITTLSFVMVCVFTLSIAYAALNAVLTIQGNGEVVASTWDIYLDNPRVTVGSSTTNLPVIKTSSTLEFSTTLYMPGDFYEFTVDVVNNGSIDAMIDSVTKTPTLTSTQAKYLNYIIEYQNGESINTKQLVSKGSFVRLKVRVEYRKDVTASDLPTTSETLNLAFTVNYVQSDGTGSSVTDNGIEVQLTEIVSGNLDTVGSEICIYTECFYVISSTEETVTMLSKYNLYVGEGYSSDDVMIEYGDEATGMQDETMKGVCEDDLTRGVTIFAEIPPFTPEYRGSIVEGYVNNYKDELEKLDVEIIEARLITKEELEGLGCSESIESCSSAPSWVYATSYWINFIDLDSVFYVNSYGGFMGTSANIGGLFGVRPVIVISKSYF